MNYSLNSTENYGHFEGSETYNSPYNPQHQFTMNYDHFEEKQQAIQPYQGHFDQSTSLHHQRQYYQHYYQPSQFSEINVKKNESTTACGQMFGTEIVGTNLNLKSLTAWCPGNQSSNLIATATAADLDKQGQKTLTSELNIFEVDFTQSSCQFTKKGHQNFESCFTCLTWGKSGMFQEKRGYLAAAMENGSVLIMDSESLCSGVQTQTQLSGYALSLDFNRTQDNLLAMGCSDNCVIVWDINHKDPKYRGSEKLTTSMCAKSVAWNEQVSHILASSTNDGCSIWDTNKKEAVMKITNSMMLCNKVAWCPNVATQICLASENDSHPAIQLWDLRQANSPLQTLLHHQSGVNSISWCKQDPNFLLSSSKDSNISCINPYICEVQGVLSSPYHEWFDVSWCPNNPGLFLTSSNCGKVSMFSIFGGKYEQSSDFSLADSFPGLNLLEPSQKPKTEVQIQSIQFLKPPKFLKRPCGASFVFGGRLLSFTKAESIDTQSIVHLSKTELEEETKLRSFELLNSITCMSEYCQEKIISTESQDDKEIWKFLHTKQCANGKEKILELLGSPSESELKDFLSDSSDDEETESENETFSGQTLRQLLLSGKIIPAIEKQVENKCFANALALASMADSNTLAYVKDKYLKSIRKIPEYPIIHAIVSNKWSDFILKLDLELWKDGLIGIMSNADETTIPSLCCLLGDRLKCTDSKESYQASLICFICAGNFEYFADCWLKRAKLSPNLLFLDLQDTVEMLSILKWTVESEKKEPQNSHSELIQNTLHHYVSVLAFNGNFKEALTFMEDYQIEDSLLKSILISNIKKSNPRGTKMGTWFSPSNSLLIDQQPQINHHVEHYPSFQDNSQTHYQSYEEEVPKGPLPPEQIPIQNIFEELLRMCSMVVSNPQHVRKIEEVRKRLDVLYEKLRGNMLSQETIYNLHEIVFQVKGQDYSSCLLTVQKMASSRSFAQLTEFLPGIKILIQFASSQNIYVGSVFM